MRHHGLTNERRETSPPVQVYRSEIGRRDEVPAEYNDAGIANSVPYKLIYQRGKSMTYLSRYVTNPEYG